MPLVLVTGATDGIGRETARELVRRGARVIVHGRSAEKAKTVTAELEDLGKAILPAPVVADFASLAQVRAMAEGLLRREDGIDVLLNNAGVYMNEAKVSDDGFEMTMAVNHLAPFLLTHLLLPRLRESEAPRIVNVSSMAHASGRIDRAALESIATTKRFEPYGSYAISKLGNVLFTVELARRLGRPFSVNALHPGVVSTKLLTEGFNMRGGESLAEGAATSVRLALAPELQGVTGRYFVRSKEAPMAAPARDRALAGAFYARSCALTGATPLAE